MPCSACLPCSPRSLRSPARGPVRARAAAPAAGADPVPAAVRAEDRVRAAGAPAAPGRVPERAPAPVPVRAGGRAPDRAAEWDWAVRGRWEGCPCPLRAVGTRPAAAACGAARAGAPAPARVRDRAGERASGPAAAYAEDQGSRGSMPWVRSGACASWRFPSCGDSACLLRAGPLPCGPRPSCPCSFVRLVFGRSLPPGRLFALLIGFGRPLRRTFDRPVETAGFVRVRGSRTSGFTGRTGGARPDVWGATLGVVAVALIVAVAVAVQWYASGSALVVHGSSLPGPARPWHLLVWPCP